VRGVASSPLAGPLPPLQATDSALSQQGQPHGTPPATDGAPPRGAPPRGGPSSKEGSRSVEGSGVPTKRRSRRVVLHTPGEALSDSGWKGGNARAGTVLSAPGVYPRAQGNVFESSGGGEGSPGGREGGGCTGRTSLVPAQQSAKGRRLWRSQSMCVTQMGPHGSCTEGAQTELCHGQSTGQYCDMLAGIAVVQHS